MNMAMGKVAESGHALEVWVGEMGAMPLGESGRLAPGGLGPEAMADRLAAYESEVVVGAEWPAICAAWREATAGRGRELVALDRAFGRWIGGDGGARMPAAVREASWRVGRRQLNRLRSLRDVTAVRRYGAAVEAGLAQGWHPVVYGVFLGVFQVPLAEGLRQHARQMMSGWLKAWTGLNGFGALERAEPMLAASEARCVAHLGRVLGGAGVGPVLRMPGD